MPIEIDIAHVARLARLALEPDELDMYRRQLGVILEHASKVQAVEAPEEPTAHPLGLVSPLRPDEVRLSLDRDEVLAEAPDRRDGYFAVPPAMEAT